MAKTNSINISLSEEDFTKLVNGQIITIDRQPANPPINIALKDIGFDRLAMHIEEAHRNFMVNAWEPKP